MAERLHRSIEEPIRDASTMSFDERWRGPDGGLILCWENGRRLRDEKPELANRADKGDLVMLDWRGGVEKKLKLEEKAGTLNYLAMWQGLRNEDLDIPASREVRLRCTTTGQLVVFSDDAADPDVQ
jgi:hypothetical protein